jgi:hypothetical protein
VKLCQLIAQDDEAEIDKLRGSLIKAEAEIARLQHIVDRLIDGGTE